MSRFKRAVLSFTLTSAIASSPAIGLATEQSKVDIDNFAKVNANYYRGGQPDEDDYADLAALGVKTVIDLQRDFTPSEQRLVEAAGMKFHRIPMTTRTEPTKEQLALFMKLVNDPANQPVYVHCAGGRHRTGIMTAAYRMTHDGWNADQAFKEMKQYKFGADFLHPEFKRFVYAYHVQPETKIPTVLATGVLSSESVAAR